LKKVEPARSERGGRADFSNGKRTGDRKPARAGPIWNQGGRGRSRKKEKRQKVVGRPLVNIKNEKRGKDVGRGGEKVDQLTNLKNGRKAKKIEDAKVTKEKEFCASLNN